MYTNQCSSADANIGEALFEQFPIEAVSVQLQVFGNENGEIYEPGFHSAVYTKGKIQPLAALPPVLDIQRTSAE